jgi:hypothetical protein
MRLAKELARAAPLRGILSLPAGSIPVEVPRNPPE